MTVKASSGAKQRPPDRLLKLLAAAAFILLAIALFIIKRDSPAKGYELSIYSALPVSVWVLLLISIGCGIFIVVYHVLYKKKGNFWLIGFFILILASLIFFILPVMRGYYLYGTDDSLGHLEYTSLVASQGSLGQNYYPVTHILGAVLIQVSSIAPNIVMMYLPVIFSALFTLFIYLLATVVSFKKGQYMLAAAAGTIPIFSYYHVAAYPHALAIFVFPLLFFLYFKSSKIPSLPWKIAFLVVLFVLPFLHPIAQAVLIVSLFVGEAAKWLWSKRDRVAVPAQSISFRTALISLATFFIWISYFAIFAPSLRRLFSWIGREAPLIARAGELQAVIAKGPNQTIDLGYTIELGLKMYGYDLLLLFLSVIVAGIVLIYFLRRQRRSQALFILYLMSLTSLAAFLSVSMALGLVTWGRILGANMGLWATPVLAGLILYQLGVNPKIPRTIGFVVIVLVLIVSSVISLFGVYRSPWILQPNSQITYADISGSDWIDRNRNSKIPITEMGWLVSLYGQFDIPDHFGYPEHDMIGQSIKQNTFLLLTKRFKLASIDPVLSQRGMVSPAIVARPGFDQADFSRLEIDPSVDKLYANGDWGIYYAWSSPRK